jgi:hypothetical protein
MKKYKIAFWVSTIFLFLFEGVMPALTAGSEMSQQAILHLGYPLYFITILTTFKILGAVVLVVPMVPNRVKEWAYAGFGIDYVSAFVSMMVVDGFSLFALFPVVVFGILAVSYISRQKLLVQ